MRLTLLAAAAAAVAAAAAFPPAAHAADAPPPPGSAAPPTGEPAGKTEASTDGNQPPAAAAPAAAGPGVGYRGPLHELGRSLNDAGLFPILIFGETYVGNPDMGYIRHSSQIGTFLVYGFDYNLPSAVGWKGTSFHFTGSATRKTDTRFFAQAGDAIVANAASNLPRRDHLTRATVMQEFADGRYFAELGKGYANDYFARPVCNNAYTCMSVIDGTHKLAGINFPNYSNWFWRGGMKISENMKIQFAKFMFSTESAGFGVSENGTEWWKQSFKPAWFADLQYADTKAARPYSYELLAFYNRIPQADSVLGGRANPTPTSHQSGLFASTMQTVWRAAPGSPQMLQAFASGAVGFNNKQTQTPTTAGFKYAVDLGVTLKAPVSGRPFDSYSVQFTQVGLTRDEQTLLASRGYGNGSHENALAFSANFRLYDYVFFQPYAQYVWNLQANNYVSLAGLHSVVPAAPDIPTGQQGKRGWALGAVFVIPFERFLGLTTRPSGYDGHYP